MTVEADVQNLSPGTMWQGFVLDATSMGGGVLNFHGMSGDPVMWQGIEYSPWPIKAEGFARTSGQQPMPKLSVGNIDGSVSLLCSMFDDLVGATLTRKRTFTKYMDGQPGADPTQEFSPELWFIERKSVESSEAVEFELSSALDFNGVKLPRRQIIANQCSFAYRGAYCNYTGPAVATILDVPTTDMSLDACSKKLSACKLRDWPDGILNYGGFAAAGLVRT